MSANQVQDLESESLRKLIDKLNEYGCGKYIELPQIAVMGDTSCGKSSLLSALSGIEFPSSEKLTTRCPTQITMTNNSKEKDAGFHATVQLRRYNNHGEPPSADPTKRLNSIGEIKNAIGRLTEQLVEEGQEISDDCIVISAKGPSLPNLTLVDLPGLVRTVKDGEDEAMIPRIRALVKRYLDNSRTIILSVVPANVDIHNTEILTLAKEVDPEGDRTISVITKPDLVDKGAEDSVIQLLLNKTKKLKLFYHAVKCRGQDSLTKGVSIADGIVSEKTFFDTESPWKDVPKELVGIKSLQKKLANLLESRIRESLPKIQTEIIGKLHKASEELESMGSALDDPRARAKHYDDIRDRIHLLLESAISGKYDRHSEFFNCDEENEEIKLRSMLNLSDQEFRDSISKIKFVVSVLDMKKFDLISFKYEGKWYHGGVLQDVIKDENLVLSEKNTYKVKDFHIRPCLKNLKKTIAANRGEELPLFPSYSIFVSIIQDKIREWKAPMEKLFENYVKKLTCIVEEAIEVTVHIPKLKLLLKSILIEECLREIENSCAKELEKKMMQEMRPYTLNHYLFKNFNDQRNRELLAEIGNIAASHSGQIDKNAVLAILKSNGIGASAPNEDQEALELLMAASAYLKVAKKRFIDDIPMILDDKLLKPVLYSIKKHENMYLDSEQLENVLKLDSQDRMRRDDLESQVKTLKAAHELMRMELTGRIGN